MLKRLLLCILLCVSVYLGSEEKIGQQTEYSVQSTSQEILDGIAEKVKKNTGDVSFSVPIINGGGISVSASYSSVNIDKIVAEDNIIAPTGVMGLGWSLPQTKIVRDHKGTMENIDDQYYLIMGGKRIKLGNIGDFDDDQVKFFPISSERIDITYNYEEEYWVLETAESRMTFGKDEGSREYTVGWGNWIGPTSSGGDDGRRLVTAWHISENEDLKSNKVNYSYLPVLKSVSGLNYTQEIHLDSIKNNSNYSVKFNYCDKSEIEEEFIDPNQENDEPDAFQEKYQTKYLTDIVLSYKDNIIRKTILDYSSDDNSSLFINSGTDKVKRLLTGIKYQNGDGALQSYVKYDYYLEDGDTIGYLKNIRNELGMMISYNYKTEEISNDYSNNIPNSYKEGDSVLFSDPRVFCQDNYTVVVYAVQKKNESDEFEYEEEVSIDVYSWLGNKWERSKDLVRLPGIPCYWLDNKTDLGITFQKDFFALTNYFYRNNSSEYNRLMKVVIWNEMTLSWGVVTKPYNYDYQEGTDSYSGNRIVSGKNYVATMNSSSGETFAFHKRQDSSTGWVKTDLGRIAGTSDDCQIKLLGAPNYFLVANNKPYTNKLILNYVDFNGDLQFEEIPESISPHSDHGNIDLYAVHPSYFVFVGSHSTDYLFSWDNNFSNFRRFELPYIGFRATQISISGATINYKNDAFTRQARWTGDGICLADRHSRYNTLSSDVGFSYSSDLTQFRFFNTETMEWVEDDGFGGELNGEDLRGYVTPSKLLYWKASESSNILIREKNKGIWQDDDIVTLPDNAIVPSSNNELGVGSNYILVNYPDNNSALFLKKDDNWQYDRSFKQFSSERIFHKSIGGSSFVCRHDNGFSLYNTEHEFEPTVTQLKVDNIIVNDGLTEIKTKYDYSKEAFFKGSLYFAHVKMFKYDNNENKISETATNYITINDKRGYSAFTLLNGSPVSTIVLDNNDGSINTDSKYYSVDRIVNSGNVVSWRISLAKEVKAYRVGDYLNNEETLFTYNTEGYLICKETNHNGKKITEYYQYLRDVLDDIYRPQNRYFNPVVTTRKDVNDIATSAYMTFYKDWGDENWFPHKSYMWDGTGFLHYLYISVHNGNEAQDNWIKTNEILSYNEKFEVTEQVDQAGIHSTTLYGKENQLPIAGITNAEESEVFYQDFEFAGEIEPFNDFENYANMCLDNEVVYSGKNSLAFESSTELNGATSYSLRYDIPGDRLVSDTYVFKCKMLAESSDSQLELKARVDADAMYYNFNNSHNGQRDRIWQDLEVIVDLRPYSGINHVTLELINRGSGNQKCYVDEISFQPVDATMNKTVYDIETMRVMSESDDSGNTIVYGYDIFDKKNSQRSHKNELLSGTIPYITKLADYRLDIDPNILYSVASETGYGNTFSSFEIVDAPFCVSGQMDLSNENLNLSEGKVTINYSQSDRMVYTWNMEGTEANISLMSDGNNRNCIKLIISGNNLTLQRLDDNNPIRSSSFSNALSGANSSGWFVTYQNDIVSVYQDGKKIGELNIYDQGNRLSSGSNISFETNDEITIDDIMVYKDAVVSAQYLNYSGQVIQSQVLTDEGLVISGSAFDSFGREVVTTKAGLFANEHFNFHPNFVNYDNATGVVTGEVMNIPELGAYPYSRVVYEDNYKSRKIEVSSPGADTYIGSQHTARTQYDIAPSSISELSSFNLTDEEHICNVTTDPNGVYVLTVYDKFGQNILVISDLGNKNITSKYEYNIEGQLVKEYMPNYFDTHVQNNQSFVKEYNYDFWGNLTQETSPDYGIRKWRYDEFGRVILEQDSNNATNSKIKQKEYDYLGRVVKSGLVTGDFDNLVYPAAYIDGPSKEFIYDETGTESGMPGSLFKGISYTYEHIGNQTKETKTTETYYYNRKGEVIKKNLKSDAFDSHNSYSIKYEYDISGNTTKITYPDNRLPSELDITEVRADKYAAADVINVNVAGTVDRSRLSLFAGNEINFSEKFNITETTDFYTGGFESELNNIIVTYHYNTEGELTSVGSEYNPFEYATYRYDYTGKLVTESLNNSVNSGYGISYNYNDEGQLVRIVSDEFVQDLSYSSGGYGGVGYYNGNISSVAYQQDGQSYNYKFSYDNVGQLTNADCSGFNLSDKYDYFDFAHDANGNILAFSRDGLNRNYLYQTGTNKVSSVDQYNTNHRSTSTIGNYNYDSMGNVVSSDRVQNDLQITYDNLTGLTQKIETENDGYFAYHYNTSNERICKNLHLPDGNVLTKIYVRGLSNYPLFETSNGDNPTFFIYGLNGLIAKHRLDKTDYIVKDHLGSTRLVLDGDDNSVSSSFFYDAFGNRIPLTDIKTDILYQYTGQEYEKKLDLYNFRARFYDSDLMRFYAVDPEEQTASPYLFCGNSPVMFVDPDGLWYFKAQFGLFGFSVSDSGISVTAFGLYVGYDWEHGGYQQGMQVGFGVGADIGVLTVEAGISASIIGSENGVNASITAGGSIGVMGVGVSGGYSCGILAAQEVATYDGWHWDYGFDFESFRRVHYDNRIDKNEVDLEDLPKTREEIEKYMEKRGWRKLTESQDMLHENQIDGWGKNNDKFVKNGKEVIIDMNTGRIDTRVQNIGTYNYCGLAGKPTKNSSLLYKLLYPIIMPLSYAGHFLVDMLPYFVLGNDYKHSYFVPSYLPKANYTSMNSRKYYSW
jgi:RHS repeat-associated protein